MGGWLDLRKVMHDYVNKSSKESLLPFDMLLTTYDIALVDQDFVSQIPWQLAVIDEAQILKNPNSLCCLTRKYILKHLWD
ncbi:unnamed protein product [Brassica oleracea]